MSGVLRRGVQVDLKSPKLDMRIPVVTNGEDHGCVQRGELADAGESKLWGLRTKRQLFHYEVPTNFLVG